MTINHIYLGRKIKVLRLAKGLSQEQLAEACGLSTSYISYIETGKKKINFSQLEKLAVILEFKIDIRSKNDKGITDLSKLLQNCSAEEKKFLLKFIRHIQNELEA